MAWLASCTMGESSSLPLDCAGPQTVRNVTQTPVQRRLCSVYPASVCWASQQVWDARSSSMAAQCPSAGQAHPSGCMLCMCPAAMPLKLPLPCRPCIAALVAFLIAQALKVRHW